MGLKELFRKSDKAETDNKLKYKDVRTELAVRLMKAEGIRQIAAEHGLKPSAFGNYVKWTEQWRQSHDGKFPDIDDTYGEYMCGKSGMVPEFWDTKECVAAMRQYLNMRELMSLWDPAKAPYMSERDYASKKQIFQDGIDTSTAGLNTAYHDACEILDEVSVVSYAATPEYIRRHDPSGARCQPHKLAESVMQDYSAETGKEIVLRAKELDINDLSRADHIVGTGRRLYVSDVIRKPKPKRSGRKTAELKKFFGVDDAQRDDNELQE